MLNSDLVIARSRLEDSQKQLAELLATIDEAQVTIAAQKQIIEENSDTISEDSETIKALNQALEEEMYNRVSDEGYTVSDWNYYIEPREVIGTWKVAAVLEDPADFDAEASVYYSNSGDIAKMEFYSNGDAAMVWKSGKRNEATWLDDCFLDEDAPMEFMIVQIDGSDYMFLELKNGDYFNGDELGYYVFEKVD